MPTQEEEEASGRPAAKAEPILKPALTSNPNFIPMKDRRWIDLEVQKSKELPFLNHKPPRPHPDDNTHASL